MHSARYACTMRLFGVSRFLVFVARVHAAEIGPDRPVAPKPVTFRITPEAAEHVTAFIDRPEFIQVHAHQKDKAGADGPLMELLLPRERLWRKYDEATPRDDPNRVSRSAFLSHTNVSSLRMLACRSCLCGPCEEYGHDTFVSLEELIKDLAAPTNVEVDSIMDAATKRSFLSRVEHLRDYLRHDYRRRCADDASVASETHGSTLCIKYALSTLAAEFGEACDHQHDMVIGKCNERYYLIDDLRDVIEHQRAALSKQISLESARVPASSDSIGAAAEPAPSVAAAAEPAATVAQSAATVAQSATAVAKPAASVTAASVVAASVVAAAAEPAPCVAAGAEPATTVAQSAATVAQSATAVAEPAASVTAASVTAASVVAAAAEPAPSVAAAAAAEPATTVAHSAATVAQSATAFAEPAASITSSDPTGPPDTASDDESCRFLSPGEHESKSKARAALCETGNALVGSLRGGAELQEVQNNLVLLPPVGVPRELYARLQAGLAEAPIQ